MPIPHSLRISNRTVVSSLFAATFAAAVLTVTVSGLPCPARPQRIRYGDDGSEHTENTPAGNEKLRYSVIVEKRKRRWIKETEP